MLTSPWLRELHEAELVGKVPPVYPLSDKSVEWGGWETRVVVALKILPGQQLLLFPNPPTLLKFLTSQLHNTFLWNQYSNDGLVLLLMLFFLSHTPEFVGRREVISYTLGREYWVMRNR